MTPKPCTLQITSHSTGCKPYVVQYHVEGDVAQVRTEVIKFLNGKGHAIADQGQSDFGAISVAGATWFTETNVFEHLTKTDLEVHGNLPHQMVQAPELTMELELGPPCVLQVRSWSPDGAPAVAQYRVETDVATVRKGVIEFLATVGHGDIMDRDQADIGRVSTKGPDPRHSFTSVSIAKHLTGKMLRVHDTPVEKQVERPDLTIDLEV